MPRAAITKAPKKTAKRPAAKAVRKSATTKIAKKSATSKPSKKSVPKKVAKKPVATKRKVTPKKPEIISTKNLTLYQFSTETTTVSTITRARSLDPSDFEAKCQKQSMYDSFRNGNYVTHEFCIYRQRSETYDSDNSYRSDRYGEREGSHCEECCDCCSLYGSDLEEESEEENIVTENVYYLGQDRAIQKVLEERTGEAMPEDKEELMALWREYGVDVDAEGLPTDDWETIVKRQAI
ncbi:hypothetical protein BJ508DRAFT_112481 [Ascobolus immersus RN42]|uniref:Uncharacterized protein n=1 Tax=Ascobolus immersus RN42 TaxID=1160509 RepID=A0A3N4I5X6_ASCIM|nr:hypothetical protein BJ508DRAFT_112481 [Ascobolus immersus RN42]